MVHQLDARAREPFIMANPACTLHLARLESAVSPVSKRATKGMGMAAANYLPEVLETTEAERLATGFIFTEGPLWHPDGQYYFVDLRNNRLHRVTPGKPAELVTNTVGGNGTTFDLQGRLVICEGDARRVSRLGSDGKLTPIAERYNGKRFDRPNDIVCHSDGSLYFTNPDKRIPYKDREIAGPPGTENCGMAPRSTALRTDGAITMVANFEYPNGLAFSPGREDAVRREHALVEIHPRDRARRGGASGRGAGSSPT
jgi:hypothetical protein